MFVFARKYYSTSSAVGESKLIGFPPLEAVEAGAVFTINRSVNRLCVCLSGENVLVV